jgi:excisionase family DNA binding protein
MSRVAHLHEAHYGMAERKPATRKKRAEQQTTFIKPAPQVKNGDILDVDEAAVLLKVSRRTVYNRVKAGTIPHARVGRKLLFSRAKLSQWVADGADLAKPDPTKSVHDHEQLTLDQLTGMLNTGQARIASKR